MSLLVTGFGPFGEVTDNASAHLAESSGHPFAVIEVAYAALDEFIQKIAKNPPEEMLLLGVDINAKKMRLETVAHNHIGSKTDVRGEVWGPGPIDPQVPPQLSATLWNPEALEPNDYCEPGYDAGGYLCNYSFFRAAQFLTNTRVGFIHIPTFETLKQEIQLAELSRKLESCRSRVLA